MNTDVITRNKTRQVILDVDTVEYPVFIKSIKNLDFVHIIQDGDSEEEIIANLTQGFKELKLYKQGKLKTTPAKEFLNAL